MLRNPTDQRARSLNPHRGSSWRSAWGRNDRLLHLEPHWPLSLMRFQTPFPSHVLPAPRIGGVAAHLPQPRSAIIPRHLLPTVCSLQPDLVGCVSRSLLRFSPHLRLLWLSPVDVEGLTRESLMSLPPIHTLDALQLDQPVAWQEVLARRGMRGLQVLRLQPDRSHPILWRDSCGAALAALPQLHTLEAWLRTPVFLPHLPTLPALTDLTLHLRDLNSAVRCISACLQFRRLTLIGVHAATLFCVFANGARPMERLEDLALVQLWWDHRQPNWLRCIQSAPVLRAITFRQRLPLPELVQASTSDLPSDGPLRSLSQGFPSDARPPAVGFCATGALGHVRA